MARYLSRNVLPQSEISRNEPRSRHQYMEKQFHPFYQEQQCNTEFHKVTSKGSMGMHRRKQRKERRRRNGARPWWIRSHP